MVEHHNSATYCAVTATPLLTTCQSAWFVLIYSPLFCSWLSKMLQQRIAPKPDWHLQCMYNPLVHSQMPQFTLRSWFLFLAADALTQRVEENSTDRDLKLFQTQDLDISFCQSSNSGEAVRTEIIVPRCPRLCLEAVRLFWQSPITKTPGSVNSADSGELCKWHHFQIQSHIIWLRLMRKHGTELLYSKVAASLEVSHR